jgi:Flp pilus assembly protein TadG
MLGHTLTVPDRARTVFAGGLCDNRSMQRLCSLRWARRNPEQGGAAVEFALVLPLFCAVLFGTVDYGWYFYQKFTLAAAVRDGLRTGVTISQSVTGTGSCANVAVTRALADMTQAGLNPPANMFTTSVGSSFPTKTLTLSGTYAFTPLVNFVPLPTHGMTYAMTMMFELQQ